MKAEIIPGSSSGIGQATVLEFAKEGASVVIHGVNTERLNVGAAAWEKGGTDILNLQETESLLEKEGVSKERILKVEGSLADEGTAKRIVEQTLGKFGKINVLVSFLTHRVLHIHTRLHTFLPTARNRN